MKVVLELQDQPSNIKKVTVRHDIVIGRGADCNLRLSAPQISRRHCFLRITDKKASVSDLDSSNGTYLNGKRLDSGRRYELKDGAMLSVGPIRFITRVRSDLPAGDVLQVSLQDDRLEADIVETPIPLDAQQPDDPSDLNFSLEQAGPAAAGDEPTADYTHPPIEPISDELLIVEEKSAEEVVDAIAVSPQYNEETINNAYANVDNADVLEADVLEIVEVEDVEIVEELDVVEELDIIDEVEEVDIVDEVEVVDELDVIEEVEIVEQVPSPSTRQEPETVKTNDKKMEAELRDFLNGLD